MPTYMQMMPMMSIWELGHRWAGFDPDETDADNLPKEVREHIRELLFAVGVFLNLFDKNGRQELDSFSLLPPKIVPSKALHRTQELMNTRQFPRKDLEGFFVLKSEVEKWCLTFGRDLPAFWYSEDEVAYHQDQLKKLSPVLELGQYEAPRALNSKQQQDKEDKALTQAIAQRLWAENPTIRMGKMIARKEIQLDANGKFHGEKVLRKWLGEVAPPEARKSGRTRNPES